MTAKLPTLPSRLGWGPAALLKRLARDREMDTWTHCLPCEGAQCAKCGGLRMHLKEES